MNGKGLLSILCIANLDRFAIPSDMPLESVAFMLESSDGSTALSYESRLRMMIYLQKWAKTLRCVKAIFFGNGPVVSAPSSQFLTQLDIAIIAARAWIDKQRFIGIPDGKVQCVTVTMRS